MLEKCLDRDPDQIKLNGKKIFAEENLNNRQKRHIYSVLRNTVKMNKQLLEKSLEIAHRMGCDNVDDALSIMEILANKVNKKGINVNDALNGLDMEKFIIDIQRDIVIATEIADRSDLKFLNSLNAVYHYHKHGENFANCQVEVYLCKVPDRLIQDANLVLIDNFSDGLVRKCYLNDQNMLAFVFESPPTADGAAGNRRIGSIHHNPKFGNNFRTNLENQHQTAEPVPDYLANLSDTVANLIGVTGLKIFLNFMDGSRLNWNDFFNWSNSKLMSHSETSSNPESSEK